MTLGSAVTASMNLTNSTEALEPSGQVPYKTETTTDMHLYYQVLNDFFKWKFSYLTLNWIIE